jgi:hypothetical protein
MRATSEATKPTLDCDPLVQYTEILEKLFAGLKDGSGPVTALMRHGQYFKPISRLPEWLPVGPPKQCYANCARALTASMFHQAPIYYAEGYAFDPALGVPLEHAWLVDNEGLAIDLTWPDVSDVIYYGVAFKSQFVIEAMQNTQFFGILSNWKLRSTLFGAPQAFEAAITVSNAARTHHERWHHSPSRS